MENQEKVWNKEYHQNPGKWKLNTKTLRKILGNKQVLELGVGNGKTLKSIIQQKPKSVVAIDISSESIEISKKLFPQKNLSLIQGNILNLPLEDDSFDCVVCYYILDNLLQDERKKAVKEIHRVLKKDGIVLFEDFAVGDFRQERSSKDPEKDTMVKDNGLYCHYSTVQELNSLFRDFKQMKFTKETSSPIFRKPKLKRKIIAGFATK